MHRLPCTFSDIRFFYFGGDVEAAKPCSVLKRATLHNSGETLGLLQGSQEALTYVNLKTVLSLQRPMALINALSHGEPIEMYIVVVGEDQ